MQNLSGLVLKVKCGFNDGSEAEVWEEFAERASKYVRTAAAVGGCRKSARNVEELKRTVAEAFCIVKFSQGVPT